MHLLEAPHMPVSPTPSLSRLTPISVFALSCQKGFRPGIDAACLSLCTVDRPRHYYCAGKTTKVGSAE